MRRGQQWSSVVASGTGITAGSGDLGAGSVVTLTVNLSSAVTVAGGTPTLTLNDGGTATYTGGSGTNALTFSYTVGAGQNTADLAVTAVNLNGATVKDGAGNAANLTGAVTNPSGTLQIDTTAPVVSTISETPSTGALNAGKVVTYTINMSDVVTVNTTGGTPTLSLNDGGTATYTSGSGTNALTFSYTVLAGQNTPDLMVSGFNLNGASIADGAGNAANLSLTGIAQGSPSVDTTAPTVASLAASGTGITAGSGDVGAGSVVTLTVNLSEAVTVAGGTPTLTLNDGGTATYTGGSGTSALTFSYTVTAGQNTSDLAVTAVNTNGAAVKDAAGNAADLTGAVANPSGTLQVDTSAHLTHVGNKHYLYNAAGVGPLLTSQGVAITDSLMGNWTFIGAEQVGSGYDVALRLSGTDQYMVWATDSNGNVVSSPTNGAVSGTSTVLESLETSFHQDLNGDGTIGVKSTVIESFGATSLTKVGDDYYLYNSGGVGPLLTSRGVAITDSQIGGWTLIGAEQVGSGYDVAVRLSGTNQYMVWATDSNGNVVSSPTGGAVSGTSTVLESLETSFHQDLNGDGTIGVKSTVIESFGATSLTKVGDDYYLYNSGGVGPLLTSRGVAITDSQIGGWTLIGAEQVGSGYDVAVRLSGTDQYMVWATDSNGVVVSSPTGGAVSGTSTVLESLETSFHQDLNGDGTIGVKSTVIESFGATSLTKVGDDYYLYNSGGVGPVLTSRGVAITDSQIGNWTLIGAEQVGSGYDVAVRLSGTNQYMVWATDSNGVVVSSPTGGAVSGTSTVLESLEASFHQDLNGDGIILLSGSGSSIGANSLVVGNGASAELTGAYSGTVSFAGATGSLAIDNSANFSGTIGGQLAIGDVIDLADINAGAGATLSYSGNNSPGTLTVNDGVHTSQHCSTWQLHAGELYRVERWAWRNFDRRPAGF